MQLFLMERRSMSKQKISHSKQRTDRFFVIETKANLPDGRHIHRVISDPKGMDYPFYVRLDNETVKAFGPSVETIGTMVGKIHD